MNKQPTGFQAFIGELKRRRVVRVALIYGAAAYAGLEGADLVLSALRAPEWVLSLLVITVFVGFPITVVLSWLFDITPQGIVRTRAEASGPPPTWFSTASIVVVGGIVTAVAAGWWLTNATGAVAPQGTGAQPGLVHGGAVDRGRAVSVYSQRRLGQIVAERGEAGLTYSASTDRHHGKIDPR